MKQTTAMCSSCGILVTRKRKRGGANHGHDSRKCSENLQQGETSRNGRFQQTKALFLQRSPPKTLQLWTVLVLLWMAHPTHAKIRVPSSFISGGSQQQNTQEGSEENKGQTSPQDFDFESIFNSWLQNWSPKEETIMDPPKTERGYGLRISPALSFSTTQTQQYLAHMEERLAKLRRFQSEFQKVATQLALEGWKTTQDVVRYKFPVGIITAWSLLGVVRKVLKIRDENSRSNKPNKDGSSENDQNNDEHKDAYKYILRHTGRALDLDSDDLTAYRHGGGIEQVRSRLLLSVLEGELDCKKDSGPNDDDVASSCDPFEQDDCDDETEDFLEALVETLSLEFIPGGSHSEYVRRLIPSFSRAEECAQHLGIFLEEPQRSGLDSDPSKSATDRNPNFQSPSWDPETMALWKIALQTAEVRILDSQLRSIRDRLIRTTYRLHRTVKYWKAKVESTRLSSSSTAVTGLTSSSLSSQRAFFNPLPKLRRKWSRFFFYGSGGGKNSQDRNSLLEGDRLRLAFAQAAYNAEIVRLGRVLNLISHRPDEMHDSTLTAALIRQKQRKEAAQLLSNSPKTTTTIADAMNLANETYGYEGDSLREDSTADETKAPRIGTQLMAIRQNILNRFSRQDLALEQTETVLPEDAKAKNITLAGVVNAFSDVFRANIIRPIQGARESIANSMKQRRRKKRKRFNKYFAIRFNADGRGKFSVQNFDEDSVTIERETALEMLLQQSEDDQKPWLQEANAWSLQARGLIVDTLRESMEASIAPSGNSAAHQKESSEQEWTELESAWRTRNYGTPEFPEKSLSTEMLARSQYSLFAISLPNLLSQSSIKSVQERQWLSVFELSRDINRLRRVGEGKSLKFKWKEVHWVHWLMQWNLMGVPSAALKILAAVWIHNNLHPHVPKVKELVIEIYEAAVEIFTTRFWTPFKDLVDEIMNRRKGLVTGVSLAEEEASLDIMLRDIGLGDGTPATRHEATIKATRQYESHMKNGLMWHALGGQLVRLMLIQMQQLKVSMLDAAETIDVLFQSNKINMQVLAIVPALGIVFVGTKLLVRFLFSVRAKDIRPITSIHAEMTDYLNDLESNIILRKTPSDDDDDDEHEKKLGEFALTLYNYLLLLDYSSPQPLPSRACDVIHQSLMVFLGRKGSFQQERVSMDGQIRLIDLAKGKHQELSKFL